MRPRLYRWIAHICVSISLQGAPATGWCNVTEGSAWLGEPFVGRADELNFLAKQRDQAAAGQGRLVLLTGPPGIGKTSLTRQFLASNGAWPISASGDAEEVLLAGGLLEQLVTPLGVIHDHGHRPLGRQDAEHVEQRGTGGQRIRPARPHQVGEHLPGRRRRAAGELFQQATGQ